MGVVYIHATAVHQPRQHTQRTREYRILYTVLGAYFVVSGGDSLTVQSLLGEALRLSVLGFPPLEIGQISGCSGSFLRGTKLLRAT